MEEAHQDDKSVADSAKLLRRLHADWVHDGVPESTTFKPDRHEDAIGTSVTIWQGAADLENVLRGYAQMGVVIVTMGEARAAGLGIVRVPLPDNPNHCELFGPKAAKARRDLSKNSRWVKYPDGHDTTNFGPLEQLED